MAEVSRNLKIGIIGAGGMVGRPHERWFREKQGRVRGEDLLCYDTDPASGYFDDINKADIIFVCVPTPKNPDGSCNTSIVESVVSKFENKIIVIKSTVPPGTTEDLQRKYPTNKFLFNPEFLTEAKAWEDFVNPIRQIIGYTDQSKDVALTVLNLLPQSYYQSPWSKDTYNFRFHTSTDAELIKYYSNVFGATVVAISNMFFDLSEALRNEGYNTNYERIRDGVSADTRVGGPAWKDVNPGSYSGFGGACFLKDLLAHIHTISQRMKGGLSDARMSILVRGHHFFNALWSYNENLLNAQNLKVEDVLRHDKEIILNKKKPIE